MVSMAILLVASSVMEGHYEWYDSWPYDAQCLFDNLVGNIGGVPSQWLYADLALIFFFYPFNIIPLFKRPMDFLEKWLVTKPMMARDYAVDRLQTALLLIDSPNLVGGSMRRFTCKFSITVVRGISRMYFAVMTFIVSRVWNFVLDIFWFAYSLWSIIEDRDIPPSRIDGNENAMTFGQIMPILLLSSLVLVSREAYDGT